MQLGKAFKIALGLVTLAVYPVIHAQSWPGSKFCHNTD